MNDPFEWQEYKDKVDELTQKLEELTSQVKEGSGEEEEGFSPLFSGNQATPRSRQPIMHYAGHMGDDVSIGNYADLRDKFENFVEDSASYLKPGVQQFDVITATMGAAQDNVYCLLTIEDDTFQSEGPAPYAGSDPWNYHIWTSASGGGDMSPCYCRSDHINDATLSFDATPFGGLSWSNLPYEDCCCSYSGTTSPVSGSYASDKFLLTFSFDGAGRGWVAKITCDNPSVDTTDLVYWGGGHVDDGNHDISKDIMNCDADIPNTVTIAGVGYEGELFGNTSAMVVTAP